MSGCPREFWNVKPISQEKLKQWMHYDPTTGVCTRLRAFKGPCSVGDVLGKKSKGKENDYLSVDLAGGRYKLHRLIWVYMTGSFPEFEVDHENGVRYDNRWKNLRPCGRVHNQQNYKLPVTNKTGYLGVHYNKKRNRYRAQIRYGGEQHRLGYFKTAAEAGAAYLAAKRKHHEFQPVPRELLDMRRADSKLTSPRECD